MKDILADAKTGDEVCLYSNHREEYDKHIYLIDDVLDDPKTIFVSGLAFDTQGRCLSSSAEEYGYCFIGPVTPKLRLEIERHDILSDIEDRLYSTGIVKLREVKKILNED